MNESERLAVAHLAKGLRAIPGDDEWLLLTNVSFSQSDDRQSDEIDIVAIGPPGVRVVEVKHWSAWWIDKRLAMVRLEAEKVTAKAKRIGAALREKVVEVGRVDGAFLITGTDSRIDGVLPSRVRNIPLCTLRDWRRAIGVDRPAVLSRNQVRELGRELSPQVPIALEGRVGRLCGYRNLKLHTPRDQRFHRVFGGIRSGSRDRMTVHLYDLSAHGENLEVRARREYEALYHLTKFPWAPRIRDSFQEVREYTGEMWFFSIDAPSSPSLAERRHDLSWSTKDRIRFTLAAIRALRELHASSPGREQMLHRNITPGTILVSAECLPILTGFELARIPAEQTVASVTVDAGEWGRVVPPEIREAGLGAADVRSDVFAMCKTVATLFEGREDRASCLAIEELSLGSADSRRERRSLQELEERFAELLEVPGSADPGPACDGWPVGQVVRFRHSDYRIVKRLGAGGIGTTYKVVGIDPASGEVTGPYVGKIVADREVGSGVLESYRLVRPHLGRHKGLSAIFEVASAWRRKNFVALMTWVEGRPLQSLVGKFAAVASELGESREAVALRWLKGACEALDVLHRNGLVHGDISPGNLILSDGDLVLTDFDLVARIGESARLPGTPMYCSPSLQSGAPTGPSDDFFALAASIFRVLFNQEPFAFGAANAKHLGLNWAQTNRAEFPAIAPFLARATHQNLDRRYCNAAQALAALEAPSGSAATLATASAPAPPLQGPNSAFDRRCFAPEWVPAMEELFRRDESQLEPGGDVMGSPGEDVVGEYLARITAGGSVSYLVDLDSEHGDCAAGALRSQGLRVVGVRSHESATDILRKLSKVPGKSPAKESRDTGRTMRVSTKKVPGVDYANARKRLLGWLRRQLIGPAPNGGSPLVGIAPVDRYPVGVLYPVELGESGLDPAAARMPEESPTSGWDESQDHVLALGEGKEATLAQPARRRRYVPPSSVGFSFFVRGRARLRITVRGATYVRFREREKSGRFRRQEYKREPLRETTLVWFEDSVFEDPVDEPFGVLVRRRRHLDGAILTVTLFNRQEIDSVGPVPWRKEDLVQKSVFEAELECHIESGVLSEYPRVDKTLLSNEEQEIELQYSHKGIYAVGHGAAVDWSLDGPDSARIWTEFLPAVEVKRVKTGVRDGQRALDIQHLATDSAERVIRDLNRFVDGYERWVTRQKTGVFSPDDRPAADRIRRRMAVALNRMRRGVQLLAGSPTVHKAFRIANQAMLNQMRQSDRIRGNRPLNYRWRPFQLAFLLSVIRSTVAEDDNFRDVADLIWFPTGGGKTEAYLGLIAFLIVWRRLEHGGAGAGTVALMRYTLRLLTEQQFVRAARIIFALELIRRGRPAELGNSPITVGIWVGQSTSPNRFDQALDCVEGIGAGQTPPNGLVIGECPWCGAEFSAANYCATTWSFEFVCLSERCDFGGGQSEALPCNVVDQALYASPPSLLIGTVDKFARLAWEGRATTFFGRSGVRPPELVIQDELHLITGPLGSVAGLYEAGLDTLLRTRGARPKYVASTATIRMAHAQVRRLYGRDVSVFPPPGLTCEDCYFASTDTESPGRLYVGYLAPRLDMSRCMAPLAAALLAAPMNLFGDQADSDALLEAWWTQVVYHTSLNSVGSSHTSYMVDVREWARRIDAQGRGAKLDTARNSDRSGLPRPDVQADAARWATLRIDQLTSRKSAKENAATFARLERARDAEGYLDVVLATNMVSVGLDVSRLALMIVKGQPHTTAEYIQASSRVGRSEVPGVVVANYHRHQASSLFHYENFRPYHESFYRFVEATSVTPYTYEVRSRALHAALVIAVRHSCAKLCENEGAGKFDSSSSRIRALVENLKRRCLDAEGPSASGQTYAHIDRLVAQWHDEARRCKEQKRGLKYNPGNDRAYDALLVGFNGNARGLWRTLHSMRNVERTAVLKEQ